MTESGAAAAYPEQHGHAADSEFPATGEARPVNKSFTSPGAPSTAQVVPLYSPAVVDNPTVTNDPALAHNPASIETVSPAESQAQSRAARWIGLAGLAGIGLCLVSIYFGTFVVGLLTLAAVIAAIGFLRATLPRSTMSWFASRHRAIDSALYFGFAIVLLLLAIGIPQ